jgi:hypothetical protein
VQLRRIGGSIGGTLVGGSRWRIDPVHVQPQMLAGICSAEQSIGGPATRRIPATAPRSRLERVGIR